MTKKQQILALRSQGLKYRQIAEKVGVSFQYAAIVCGQSHTGYFRAVTADECIWPNLRNWINVNRICRNAMLRRMGLTTYGENNMKLGRILKGTQTPSKEWIDRLICATGLPYEQLFAEEAQR